MSSKEVDVNWHWIDDECAMIECPYCHQDIMINIEETRECCGRKYLLHQKNWVTEEE